MGVESAMAGPVGARLPDGRLHLQHGPMDLLVSIDADPDAKDAAEQAAVHRFATILEELVAELSTLRSALTGAEVPTNHVHGAVARRMVQAAVDMADVHVTPMVAVAGSVADEVAAAIAAVDGVRRATVNNGGDLSLVLRGDAQVTVGLVDNLADPTVVQRAVLAANGPSRGLATSGWGGRSMSLGVADAVTVVAASAAVADAAATLIANAVDVDHPEVRREPATAQDPDSDLGDRLVTVAVGQLPHDRVATALEAGVNRARELCARIPGLHGVALSLQGQRRTLGMLAVETADPTTSTSTEHSMLAHNVTPASSERVANVG